MKQILLTQGKSTIVDVKNFNWLNQWKWYAVFLHNRWYAQRHIWINKKRTVIQMQRLIMGLTIGNKECVDHINNDSLDNREQNLRICSYRQNSQNANQKRNSSSKYKGVNWIKRDKKWQARITFNYKTISLGYFTNERKAAKAYDRGARRFFGEFAKCNFKTN